MISYPHCAYCGVEVETEPENGAKLNKYEELICGECDRETEEDE